MFSNYNFVIILTKPKKYAKIANVKNKQTFAYCGFGIIGGTVSYGTLTAVLQLISQIQAPFANITGYLPKFYAMTASAERLREAELFVDDNEGKTANIDEVKKVYEKELSSIKVDNVSFSYRADDNEKTISNVDFIIK